MAFSTAEYLDASGWQQRALRRSLDQARARSVDQMDRLVAAARALANETGSAGFTVHQVAHKAGLSLKTFYRCFAGKDELLLALLEEDSSIGAEILLGVVAEHTDPVERLHAYVRGFLGFVAIPEAVGYAGVLVREHRRLLEVHPAELRVSLASLVGPLAAELAAADAAGLARVPDPGWAADTIFSLLLAGVNDVTLGRADPHASAEQLWEFCWSGIGGSGAAGSARPKEEEPRR